MGNVVINSLISLLLFLLLAIFIVGGQRDTVHSEKLWPLVNDYWTWRLANTPEYGTKYGFYEHDDKVENYSEAAITEQYLYAKQLLQLCKNFVSKDLTIQDKLTLSVMQANLQAFIDGYAHKQFGFYNQIGLVGVSNDDPLGSWKALIRWKKLKTEQDYYLWLRRLQNLPTQFQERQLMMAKAIKANTTFHNISLSLFLQSLEMEIHKLRNTTYTFALFVPFANISNDISETTRNQILEKVLELKTPILNALESFLQFVRNEYAPNSRQIVGVHSLPGGNEYYQACLKWHTSLDLTAREIHDIGLREVDRILGKIREEAVGFDSVKQYLNDLKQNPENYFETEEEVTQYYHEILNLTLSKLHLVINNIPKIPVHIAIDATSGGYYADPSLDGSRPGVIYLSNASPKTRYKFNIIPLMLHEGVPGHHLQVAYASETNIPYFRRAIEFRKYYGVPFNWPFYTAYIEGWGLYAESLGKEMGAFNVPHAQTGRYMTELFRAARLVVDTGIHAFNWTVEQAVDYFKNVSTMSETHIRREVTRYITWPGQACAYKIGEMAFQDLRKEATSSLGSRFNLKDFHDEILKLGPVPLPLMKDHIRQWISSQNISSRISYSSLFLFFSVLLVKLLAP